jgi:hypothetical protein
MDQYDKRRDEEKRERKMKRLIVYIDNCINCLYFEKDRDYCHKYNKYVPKEIMIPQWCKLEDNNNKEVNKSV